MEVYTENSCVEGDSNAYVLPSKKSSKKKAIPGPKRGGGGRESKKDSKLSKSRKRKLQKLEEEKERAVLLSKSIETLEKFKIPEDALSILRSSKNLSRVETLKEKRSMAVHLSKAGLQVPHNNPSSKRRGRGDSVETEDESGVICLMEDEDDDGKDQSQPIVIERGVRKSIIEFGSRGGSVLPVQAEVSPNKHDLAARAEDLRKSPLTPCNNEPQKSSVSMCELNEDLNSGVSRNSNSLDPHLQMQHITPTMVHVSRPNEVEEKRIDLPIVMMEQEIMEAVNYHSSVIICGETGCGKTTQVPQFLYEAGFGSNKAATRSGIIGVTQPRRVAVLATAKRVAFEIGLRLGKEVGFQVRHDKQIGDSCSIKFMTDGILLREVQNDILLKRYSILILDEAHERSVNTDILIGMLSRVIQLRQKKFEEQQRALHSNQCISPENRIFPLKLILMSATLRVEDFISGRRLFHNPPPIIEVPSRQYSVTVHYSKRTDIVDYISQAFSKVMFIHKKLPPGGILVFVTGQREVEFLCQKLRKASRQMVATSAEGNAGKEFSGLSEMDSIDGIDMKSIKEAFDIHGGSTDQHMDRFSTYDEDIPEFDEHESDVSYDSDTESEVEILGEDKDLSDRINPESDSDLVDVLGAEGNLAQLKAAFEALAGKTESKSDFSGKENSAVSEQSIEEHDCHKGKMGGREKAPFAGALHVLPLYAMLPAAAQLRVFEEIKEGERLVVVATNVAETSLTIPGIKYVVDTGREKVKNYNPSNGMETYKVQWISKASAAQRTGRAGRTGPGHCFRLYTPAVFGNILPDFSCPEISKVPVDSIVLLLKSMSIDKVENFPFPTPPDSAALVEAERSLKTLEALDSNGRLTPLGKAMAYYPMSPRHSRMLLTVIQLLGQDGKDARANRVLGYAVAAAAALSLSNPFIMQFEGSLANSSSLESEKSIDIEEKLRKKKLKEIVKASYSRFLNPTSDALTSANALHCFELSESPVEFCNENALHLKTMEEMCKLRKQLLQLVFHQNVSLGIDKEFLWTHGTLVDVEKAWRVSSSTDSLSQYEEQILGQSIYAGWADRVARRGSQYSGSMDGNSKANAVKYQACMVKETVFLHRWSSLSRSAPKFLVYSELLQTKHPYMHGATSVEEQWLVKYARSLCSFSPVEGSKPAYDYDSDQVSCIVTPTFGPHLWELKVVKAPISKGRDRMTAFAYALLEGKVLKCLELYKDFMASRSDTILDRLALGQSRVGNLVFKLEAKMIDSRARLKEVWEENPRELYAEIQSWFKKSFHKQFEELWAQLLVEAQLERQESLPKRLKSVEREVAILPNLRYADDLSEELFSAGSKR